MTRLTKTQVDVLERSDRGDYIHFMDYTGRSPSRYFWHNGVCEKHPRRDTVESLLERGYLERYAVDWRGCKVRITEAGRAAMAAVDMA